MLGIINHRNNNLLDHSLVVMNNTREWGNEGCEKRSVTLYNTKYFLVTTKNLDGIRYFFNFNQGGRNELFSGEAQKISPFIYARS